MRKIRRLVKKSKSDRLVWEEPKEIAEGKSVARFTYRQLTGLICKGELVYWSKHLAPVDDVTTRSAAAIEY